MHLFLFFIRSLLSLPQCASTNVDSMTQFSLVIWFKESGTFTFRGAVEDSATAEISRWQCWQWIYHRVSNLLSSVIEPD